MTISDTIRKAALGPKPVEQAIQRGWWTERRLPHAFDSVLDLLPGDYPKWADAPEEVQRMFLLFCAEDCES